MKLAVIAFSPRGMRLGRRIGGIAGLETSYYAPRRHAAGTDCEAFDSIYALCARLFAEREALVFVGAAGIAVRAIAPWVKSKLADPAVVVCDETGRFAISLLSGHAGGANQLTEQIAAAIGAQPVITTASDCHAALSDEAQPRNLILGIGCRRGLSAETIERAATILLWDQGIPLARVREIATIDLKRGEAGLLGFAAAHRLPLRFFTAQQLAGLPGDFSASERVLRVTGVDNVCERAAVLCGKQGRLIMKKAARDGVTVAVFERE